MTALTRAAIACALVLALICVPQMAGAQAPAPQTAGQAASAPAPQPAASVRSPQAAAPATAPAATSQPKKLSLEHRAWDWVAIGAIIAGVAIVVYLVRRPPKYATQP